MKKILYILCIIIIFTFSFSVVTGEEQHPKIAYLTFDDGPTSNTPKILDLLKKYNAKSTFFVLEDRISLYSDYIRQIAYEGHSIGLHGVSHDVNIIYATATSPLDEMNKANETLYKVLGVHSHIVRTPYGSNPYMSKRQAELLESSGYKIWDWTIDPRDGIGKSVAASTIMKNIKKAINDVDIPVILLHDRKSTVSALEQILEYLTSEGYELRPISEAQAPINSVSRLTK